MLKVWLYKTTVVHSLLLQCWEVIIWCCRWFQESVHNGLHDPELMWSHSIRYAVCSWWLIWQYFKKKQILNVEGPILFFLSNDRWREKQLMVTSYQTKPHCTQLILFTKYKSGWHFLRGTLNDKGCVNSPHSRQDILTVLKEEFDNVYKNICSRCEFWPQGRHF